MNLIEALKKANGRPVARCFGNFQVSVKKDDYLVWRDNRRVELTEGMLLAYDWYVVEPKSPIEDAIERECGAFWGDIPAGEGSKNDLISTMRRIVNLTLDEAKRVLTTDTQHKDYTIVINKRIDALKVKE